MRRSLPGERAGMLLLRGGKGGKGCIEMFPIDAAISKPQSRRHQISSHDKAPVVEGDTVP